MEEQEDPNLARLVRARFPDIPDDVFAEAPVRHWLDMLGFEAQMEIAEEISNLRDEEVVAPAPQQQETIMSVSFSKLPADVWAYMLKDTKNSTLRALCRTDRWFHANCAKIIDKIGVLRHGQFYVELVANTPPQYRVEALIAVEVVHLLKTARTNFVFQFKKRGGVIAFELTREFMYVRGSDERASRDVALRMVRERIVPFAWLPGSVELLRVVPEGLEWWKDSRVAFSIFFGMLSTYQLHLWNIMAQEAVDMPSKKDGKPFVYHGERDVDTSRITGETTN